MSTPSATLTMWASSWLAGRHAPDDVLTALGAWARGQYVVAGDPVAAERLGITDPAAAGTPAPGPMTLLKTLRVSMSTGGAQLRLVLPVPGDVRGVPVGTAFAVAAMAAGEGVVAGVPGTEGVGLIPTYTDADTLEWTVYSVEIPTTTGIEQTLGEAEYSMREAVREAADALARIRAIPDRSGADDPRTLVETQLAVYSQHRYPDNMPHRARRVLDTTNHVAAILTVAEREPSFTPASASGARTREDLLRPLRDAIRSARLVAIRACVEG